MNSTLTPSHFCSAVMNTESPSTVVLFQWLLILGFPPSVAAATAMPEIFRADESAVPSELRPIFRTAV